MGDVTDLRQARYRAEQAQRDYIDACNDVAREVHYLHHELGWSYSKLAEELDISRGRAQQLANKGKGLVNDSANGDLR